SPRGTTTGVAPRPHIQGQATAWPCSCLQWIHVCRAAPPGDLEWEARDAWGGVAWRWTARRTRARRRARRTGRRRRRRALRVARGAGAGAGAGERVDRAQGHRRERAARWGDRWRDRARAWAPVPARVRSGRGGRRDRVRGQALHELARDPGLWPGGPVRRGDGRV